MQATALLNEAFLKLVDANVPWQSRAHFMAITVRAMHQILVDHTKTKKCQKHRGDEIMVTLHEANEAYNQQQPDVLNIKDALIN